MSSKKKHRKKQFKAQQPKPQSAPQATVQVEAPTAAVITPTPQATAEVAHLSLINRDVRRVMVLAASFVGVEIILWYLFGHTGLGSAVYNLIKL